MTAEHTPLPTVQAAVEDLRNAHRQLLYVVDSLSPADWDRPVPYGEWTVKDLISHAIGDMSPSGPGLILAGVLTPEFISDTSKTFDARGRNQAMVDERRRYTREDLRQLLFEAHDAMIEAALRLDESHLAVLAYPVPMGEDYTLRVEDWLWRGYHDRQHADDIRRALEIDYKPEHLAFIPEIEERLRKQVRAQEGFLRAAYSVADGAWTDASQDCAGWTYHDVLAHVSSNEVRRVTRLRTALEGPDVDGIEDINDVDAWNAGAVAERRGWTMRALIDEFLAGWNGILHTLSEFKPEHLVKPVVLGPSREPVTAAVFLNRMAAHTTTHAGHLVPASRDRRLRAG